MYTLSGDYFGLNGNETAWTPIAQTLAVPLPNGEGIIIPVQSFDTVSMPANEIRSFYITLRDKYLDSTATAMQERGAVDRDFDAFRLDVGGGLSEYKFPAAFDETVHPKFAGVIHYVENAASCEEPITTSKTRVKYDFLVDVFGNDQQVFADIAAAINEVLENELAETDGTLAGFVGQHDLRMTGSPESAPPAVPLRESVNQSRLP